MRDLRRNDVTQKSYADKRTYNYDELYVPSPLNPPSLTAPILFLLLTSVCRRANDEVTEGQAQAFQFVDYSPLVFAHIRELSSVSMESYKVGIHTHARTHVRMQTHAAHRLIRNLTGINERHAILGQNHKRPVGQILRWSQQQFFHLFTR